MEDTRELVARICHETIRAYCKSIGDDALKPWDEAPEWQRTATLRAVDAGSLSSPEKRHQQWMQDKLEAGWKRGPEKDHELRTHPFLVPYEDLLHEQRVKDDLMNAVIDSYARECAKEAA